MKNQIRVYAPATVANVACGFDILGFAVAAPGDEVVLRKRNQPGIVITKITGEQGQLPIEPEKNTAGVSVLQLLQHLGEQQGFEIELHKKMPLGSGLGSSAASSVASVFAANELLGNPLSREALLPFALEGERVACGAAHADNAAPALYGGFVLIRSYDPLDVIRIPTPKTLHCTLIHPHIEVRTEDARKILKKEILFKDAIVQWGNIAGLIAGLMLPDYELIRRSLQDVIIEPVRSILIPHFQETKQAALESGALGCSISGSGPSMFALSLSLRTAQKVGDAMQKCLENIEIESDVYISKINQEGPRILADGAA
ncbi:homoserine kinase [candidate division KSB1 bacterium]|nr:homoserine kinase [candidate division KSB1 bacterium]